MTTQIIEEKELTALKQTSSRARSRAESIVIESDSDLKKAADFLSNVKKAQKLVKEKKESITKPMNLALKNARSFFAPFEQSLEESERLVKGRMIGYEQMVQRKAAEEARRIEEELHKKAQEEQMTAEKLNEETNLAMQKMAEIKTVDKQVEGKKGWIQYRIVKQVEIIDETLIPIEYLVPDFVKIRKVALAGVEIPGVQVKEIKQVAGY